MPTPSSAPTVVVASGYFDPLHYGHVEYLQRSKALGTTLVVIVNNDEQARQKKGQPFMPARERVKLVRSLGCVDVAIEACDKDRTVIETLKLVHPDVFTNGGDQTNESIPEAKVCRELNIRMVDELGYKIQSSSYLIAKSRGEKVVHKNDPNQ
jgi:cytidyltransferase-like protein